MTQMTTEQRDYFVNRLNEEARDKIKAKAVELFGPSGRPQQPTWGAIFDGIVTGEITLREDQRDNTRCFLNPEDVIWPAMDAKKAELEEYTIMIAYEKQKAMDAVMLDKAAVEALAAFTAL